MGEEVSLASCMGLKHNYIATKNDFDEGIEDVLKRAEGFLSFKSSDYYSGDTLPIIQPLAPLMD